jgi:hypothetical protein
MSRQASELPNYIINPYQWRTHYNIGERYITDDNGKIWLVPISRRELLIHTFNLLFPKLYLNFELAAIEPTLFEFALYYKYSQTEYCKKLSDTFISKCLLNFNQLKQEVSMSSKNPESAAKKAVAKKTEAAAEKKGRMPSEEMQYCINLVVQQKMTDDEIMAALAKEFPGKTVLSEGRQGLSHLRWHLNKGKTKVNGETYTGATLVRIVKEKPAAEKKAAAAAAAKPAAKPAAPAAKQTAKAPAKTAAKIPAKQTAKTNGSAEKVF